MVNKLFIIRGASGSGKTTLAKMLGHPYFEADMYFTSGGVYRYDATQVKQAHEWCRRVTEAHLAEGLNVTVANTFTKAWEVEPYLVMAMAYHAEVHIVRCVGQFENTHNVPASVVERMREGYEPVSVDEVIWSPYK